ncbi:hypothetical protein K438DRAFT_1930537 [Mycena galopus ATCC 62051]|nr:hypothetical protein K438DRAFT_1930537 [Mycena galopus ATCC 62051]
MPQLESLSTPTLWRAISLYLSPDTDLKSRLRCLERWLTLSRFCSLSIQLYGPSGGDDHDGHYRLYLAPFIAAIVPHSARWEHLQIRLPLLSVGGGSIGGGWWGPDLTPFIEAPQLRAVVLKQFTNSVHLPWTQLTMLRMDLVCPSDFMSILHLTVNLVHCKLTLLTDDGFHTDRDALTGWFGLATLPALCKLQVSDRPIQPEPIATILGLVSRSGCSLQQLYLVGTPDLKLIVCNSCILWVIRIPRNWSVCIARLCHEFPRSYLGRRVSIGNLHFADASSLLSGVTESDDIETNSGDEGLATESDYEDLAEGLFG